MGTGPHQAVLERIRGEYLELPGMKLTLEQVQRLCGVERSVCKIVLESLVETKVLCLRSDGSYARVPDGVITRPRPAEADLRPDACETASRTTRQAS